MTNNIKIGDKVKFLDDVGQGKVIKIIDSKTVLIETEDGFDYPYPIDKLIVIEDEHSSSSEKNNSNEKKTKFLDFNEPEIIKDNEEIKIFLSIIPENQYQISSTKFKFYLVNDSNWHLLYVYQKYVNNLAESIPGHLGPNLLELLFTSYAEEIKSLEEISFQFIFFKRTKHQQRKPLLVHIKLKEDKLLSLSSYTENDYFEEKALFYPIVNEHPLEKALEQLKNHDFHKIKEDKEVKNKKLNEPYIFRSAKLPELWEIDLHITELLDNTRGMSASDMLEYQMKIFKQALEKGLNDANVKKIVFIHGKGNGTLRQRIREHLDHIKIPYQDASFARYGFGATLVFVNYNRKNKL